MGGYFYISASMRSVWQRAMIYFLFFFMRVVESVQCVSVFVRAFEHPRLCSRVCVCVRVCVFLTRCCVCI